MILIKDLIQATTRSREAYTEFENVIARFPTGLPDDADGAQQIKNASNELSVAREELMRAHNRLNGYLGRRIVPEGLKLSG
jgi:uncharacterized phage infection (PIP) family protein YhgE